LKQARQTKDSIKIGVPAGIRRLIFFTLFSLVCSAAALYVMGAVRNFTEKTQFFLLNATLYSGLFFAVCVFLDFVSGRIFMLRDKEKRIPRKFTGFLILALIAFMFSGMAAAIIALTKGNTA
jgi:predicted permease